MKPGISLVLFVILGGLLIAGCALPADFAGRAPVKPFVSERIEPDQSRATSEPALTGSQAPLKSSPRENRVTPTWTASPAATGAVPAMVFGAVRETDLSIPAAAPAGEQPATALSPAEFNLSRPTPPNSPLPTPPYSPEPTPPDSPLPTPPDSPLPTPTDWPVRPPSALPPMESPPMTPTGGPSRTTTPTITRGPTRTPTGSTTPTPTGRIPSRTPPGTPMGEVPTPPDSPLPTPTPPDSPLPTPTPTGTCCYDCDC